jgi:hypothetical protein
LGVIFIPNCINKTTGKAVLVSFKVEVLIDKCEEYKMCM